MRFRFLVPAFSPILFLTSCEPSLQSGPRVELVGSSRFTTADRRLTTPGDTVAAKVYAEADDSPLQRLTITTEYVPIPEPVFYDPPYDLDDPPRRTYTYLDSSLTAADAERIAFQHVLGARTTAGLEVWRYQATDEEGRTGVRSFRLRLGRTDSVQAYHSYTVPVQRPDSARSPQGPGLRSFLALREGLVFPKFSVHNLPENQALVDVVYLPQRATGAPTLATAQDDTLALKWPTRRATVIRSTTLNATTFAAVATEAGFAAAFTQGNLFTPRATSTGPLTKGQVIAFQTPAPDSRYGLILVQDVITTGIRTLVLQVRVAK
ncbi:hypothetical protein K3G63_19025 [Hymenobacter sp. HSC-4F20]|uniref:hypothetical protein n=1 Tax=Hymenobacter sp. HSC-4F20 TaxID=2864135 RepID=UPI001C735917|nr:hypothetical protein [Hymenobacter sp. HSC-4F20]MBX0292544.1 hypothetical protein [Hymenobacter sp. HSC-4F20]